MQGFFNTGGRRESEPSRPKFVNPRTGKEQSWQRASNFAAPLESPFGLIKHHGRQIVRGINRRLDLARMLLTGAAEGEKVDEVITTALAAAEDKAKANNGTAVHAALGLCDTGKEVPQEYWPHAAAYVAELKREGLRPVACEQRILNTRLGATGTFDRVYVTDSGRYLVGDLKTGNLERSAHKFGVQLEVYAGGDFLVHPNGSTEPIPWDLDQDAALIIHVDPDTGATSIYEVPLRVARWGAALAEAVRAFQRSDILLPYSGAPAGPLAAQLHSEASQDLINAHPGSLQTLAGHGRPSTPVAERVSDPDPVANNVVGPIEVTEPRPPSAAPALADFTCRYDGKLASEHPIDVPGQFHCITPVSHAPTPEEQAQAKLTNPLAATTPEDRRARQEAAGTSRSYFGDPTEREDAAAQSVVPQLEQALPDPEARMAELMHSRNNKAKLQEILHGLGWRDLAHNRKWLAEKIIELESAKAGARAARPSAVLAETIEEGKPPAETTPFLLKKISEASTIEDLTAIRDNVIARTGPQAWSAAMDEVAAARAAELQGAAAAELNVLGEIMSASSTQDLARIWNRVTNEGAVTSAWTPAMDVAAKARGVELQAAQPPNPNPWGSA